MIKINSRLHRVDPNDVHRIVEQTILWCQENLGVNNRRRNPLSVEVKDMSLTSMGEFNYKENSITVYYWMHIDVGSLVSTVIHEYTHYLQPVRKYYNKLWAIHKYHSRHPMERQAFRTEKKYFKICWNDIKSSVNSK